MKAGRYSFLTVNLIKLFPGTVTKSQYPKQKYNASKCHYKNWFLSRVWKDKMAVIMNWLKIRGKHRVEKGENKTLKIFPFCMYLQRKPKLQQR